MAGIAARSNGRRLRTENYTPPIGLQKSSSMNPRVAVPKDRIATFCRDNGIGWLAIFGSALRDDFGPHSDIDVLVRFLPDRVPGLLALAGMELELSKIFDGHKIDLRTEEELSDYFRSDVLRTAQVQYEQDR